MTIANPKNLAYATAWINACIVLHAFCMDQELEIDEKWLKDGQIFEHELSFGVASEEHSGISESIGNTLNKGKKARERLKRSLLEVFNH